MSLCLGGYSTFILVRVYSPKGRKWRQIWGLAELISSFVFDKNAAFRKELWLKWGFLCWVWGHFLGLGTEHLTKFRHFEQTIGKLCDCWFKKGSCGTEKCWKGGLVEWLREQEKGVFPAAYHRKPFQSKYPHVSASQIRSLAFEWHIISCNKTSLHLS